MTAAFFKHVNKLPPEIHSVLENIRELDQQASDLSSKAEAVINAALAGGSLNVPSNDVRNSLAAAVNMQQQVVTLSSEKLGLAKSLYQSAEKQVRHMDKVKAALMEDISKREADLGLPPTVISASQGIALAQNMLQAMPAAPTQSGGGSKAKRKRKAEELAAAAAPVAAAAPGMVPFLFNLPGRPPFEEFVDPTEPLYCSCRQPTQGDMLACDGDDCAIEWFHYACAGLDPGQPVPKKWYCPDCRLKESNKPSKRGKKG